MAKHHVEIKDKMLLTIDEAAAYFGIGTKKLRSMCDQMDCSFIVWNGNKRLIKRKAMEEYLNSTYSI